MFFKNLWLQATETFRQFIRGDETEAKQRQLYMMGQIGFFMLALGLGAFSILQFTNTRHIFLGIAVSLILLWVGNHFRLQIKLLDTQRELRANWGKEMKKNREMDFITEFYNVQKEREEAFFVDDRTWMDLDMDTIFQRMDRNQTNAGEQYLYYLLRKPEMKLDELAERNQIISVLEKDEKLRHSLQIILSKVGKDKGEGVVPFIWGDLPDARSVWPYRLLSLLAFAAIAYTVQNPVGWLFSVAPIFAINMLIHNLTKKKIYRYLGSLFYLGRFLAGAKKIARSKVKHPEIARYQVELAEALKPVAHITKKTGIFVLKNDPIAEYFLIISLQEVKTFYRVINSIAKNQQALQKIFQILGQLDAYLSIASYRAGLPYYSEPQLSRKHEYMQVEGLYHPLLKEPVSNSFDLAKHGALITGSNMSGKSTLLRAVGINALLAQTIYTSISKSYRGNFYKLLTSIGRSDNVISGDSYYLVEAKALKRIIEELSDREPILCIVDEIFRGTNSLERIAASAEVLRYLAGQNCLLFAATHDLELTEMLNEQLHNFHFKETVDETGLRFDYQLRPGPSTTRNAINLLDFLGYPAPIIEGARETIRENEKKIAAFAVGK